MANVATFDGDVFFRGNLRMNSIVLPDAAITDEAQIQAGVMIDAAKLRRRLVISERGISATSATTKTVTTHIVYGATATAISVKARLTTKCTSGATVTVDVKKNGTTILSAPISFADTDSDGDIKDGTISVDDFVADDVITFVFTATAGGGSVGTGMTCQLIIDEDPE